MKQLVSPNGTRVIGTLEHLTARANVNSWEVQEDGTLEPVWEGSTEVFWDGQMTVTRKVANKDVTIVLDESGDEFLLTDCRVVEDEDDEDEDGPVTYRAEIDAPPAGTPCACEDCSWSGPFAHLLGIGDCSLTPGDPSPAGRCPECETLAYVVKTAEGD